MTLPLLILRPEPGASRTLERARELGLAAIAAPLFTVRPLAWEAPDPAGFDALLLTSANAARHGGPALAGFLGLPCYTVGAATAEAAGEAGFRQVYPGPGTAADAAEQVASDGHCSILHLCGRDHIAIEQPGLSITRRLVYAADPVAALPEAASNALAQGAVALLHSARAARRFAELAPNRERILLATLSQAVADAAGPGWRGKAVAAEPSDSALLELAAKLCQIGRPADEERSAPSP